MSEQIKYNGVEYWNKTEASIKGVLGGYEKIDKCDIVSSKAFYESIKGFLPACTFDVADCGAGIGRVSAKLLSKLVNVRSIDFVEPAETFVQAIKTGPLMEEVRNSGKFGEIHQLGLQEWTPKDNKYGLIHVQWCLSQLTDEDAISFIKRARKALREDGVIVIKENISQNDFYDQVDDSVTRTDETFRGIFGSAGARVITSAFARGMPSKLLPVKSYAIK